MTDRRAFVAGLCFVAGGVPLVLFYGLQPFGYVGGALVVLGAVIAYGARIVDSAPGD